MLNYKVATMFILTASSLFAGVGKKYGIAGCGLGSMVMGKSSNQVLAATTNGTGGQIFAITTGTSNCADDGVALADKEKEYFSNANYESLKQEMAQGKGENLYAMASLFGCQGDAFASSMKTNYTAIFPTTETDSDAMLETVENLVGTDSGLNLACSEVN